MALVDYGSSGSEIESEDEEIQPSVEIVAQKKPPTDKLVTASSMKSASHDLQAKPSQETSSDSTQHHIAGSTVDDIVDEDDVLPSVLPSGGTGLGLQLPAPRSGSDMQGPPPTSGPPAASTSHSSSKQPSILAGLPAPRVEADVSGFIPSIRQLDNSEDVLEDEVKPKSSQKCDILPPGKNKKKTGRVQITVPSLSQYDSDDEDTSQPTVKPKPSAGMCGLFDLLPQPKNISIKERNRSLLPHTLRRPPAQPSKPKSKPDTGVISKVKVVKSSAPAVNLPYKVDSDISDSDDEDTSFFSLSDSQKAPGPALPQPALDVPVHSQDLVRPSLHTLERPLTSAQPHGTDQPLAFSKPSDQLNPARMSTLSLPGGPTGHVAEGGPSPTDTEGVQYEGCAGQDYGLPNPPEEEPTNSLGMSAEEIKRLTGGRGAEAAMLANMIDVSGDTQTSTEELMKQISEEPENRGSFSKKRRKDMPSTQQKRKHQITYLAFEAKERETALKNQWSDNRAAKHAAQNRYGF